MAMLQYLAEQSRRSLVLAVEEPEAFLHPAAQESIKAQLEELAVRSDVSLLITTHSPYVISRTESTLVTELRKNPEGITEKAASAHGDEQRASLLGSLYRDVGLAQVVERSLAIPSGTRLVVVTEGFTDGHFLRVGCKAGGQPGLVNGMHFVPAGRAAEVVPQAVLADAATQVPVIALLDHDDNGRAAIDKLKSFNWEPSKRILSLSKWPGSCSRSHDIEIEDLLPPGAVASMISELGEDKALDGKVKCGSNWHYQLSKAWKEAAILRIEAHMRGDGGGMIWLAEELWRRASALQPVGTAARR